MPLRCRDPVADRSILAFDLSPEEWRALQKENRSTRHLRMPCCKAQVVLKRSPRHTRFFAHKSVGECSAGRETEAHRYLKRIAVEAARAHGWYAETEVAGTTDKGDYWKADVLARKAKSQVAIEIQWSSQTNEETLHRHARYEESGVRCLWLFRHRGFPVSRALPAVRVSGNPDKGFVAVIPTATGEQSLSVQEFFDAVFNKRFRFGLPLGCNAMVSIQAGPLHCWSCRNKTQIITAIVVNVGPYKYRLTVRDLDTHLFERVRGRIPNGLGIGSVKRRYSKTQKIFYRSNGCSHCGARMGDFSEIGLGEPDTDSESPTGLRGDRWLYWTSGKTVCEFPTRIDELWQGAVRQHQDYVEGWGVYAIG